MSQPALGYIWRNYVAFTGGGVLVIGWMSGISARRRKLCVLYGVTVLLLMLALRRHRQAKHWRDVADVLEELTTTRYFGTTLIVLTNLYPAYCKTMSYWLWRGWLHTAGPA